MPEKQPLLAITLWQPWATLLALGLKKYETRSWPTPGFAIGQPCAIHAAVRKPRYDECNEEIISALANRDVRALEELPLGAIVAVSTFQEAAPAEEIAKGLRVVGGDELAFGDFTPGRFAWRFSRMTPIQPVEAKGMQQVWRVPATQERDGEDIEVLAAVRRAYRAALDG